MPNLSPDHIVHKIEDQLEQLSLEQLIEIQVKLEILAQKTKYIFLKKQEIELKLLKVLPEKREDDSVNRALQLVEKWLKEEDYDEDNYPQIASALQENETTV